MKGRKMRKGQYTLVEQVILFALGISITLGFLFAFKDLRGSVKSDMKDSQGELVAEYVASAAVEIAESGADGRMEVPIPNEIASETYAVRAGEGGIQVQVSGGGEVAPLYGLGSRLSASGAAESTRGGVSVTLVDTNLEIEGVQ